MIKFKRGLEENWKEESSPLADGQPGYDKTNNKLKIGNGKDKWEQLDYLKAEVDTKTIFNPASSAEPDTIITYGLDIPTSETPGRLYLQYGVETDFIISSETYNNNTSCRRVWYSGFCEYFGKTPSESKYEDIKKIFSSVIFEYKTSNFFELKGILKQKELDEIIK